jgi:hypothetical protein
MQKPAFEIAQVIEHFAGPFIRQYQPNSFALKTLHALHRCRTASLGGHKEKCDTCGKERFSYNSCKDRHCPKCQNALQAFWVEERMKQALEVKHFHIVFTVPDSLNEICILDSRKFYDLMFECMWDTLRTFGYSHYGVESGAICVLHTWGQNLSLHPHIHCIVPAAGLTLAGNLKRITKKGKFLYPNRMLSSVFRGKMMEKLEINLTQTGQRVSYQELIKKAWKYSWVVNCEEPFSTPKQIVHYLSQYIHRVAITNQRILNIDKEGVTFLYKDYRDNSKRKIITLSGEEFLRRFCMHILPKHFVRIRYYGIMSSKMKSMLKPDSEKQQQKQIIETPQQRIKRLTGFDVYQCPFCKKGHMLIVEVLPRIRAPGGIIYQTIKCLSKS